MYASENSGFSLVEMLLVLVIAVMGFAVAGPSIMSGRANAELKSSARDVASALRFLRGNALTTGKETKLDLSLNDNSYQLTGKNRTYKISKDIAITLFTAQKEITDDGLGSIRFFPDGSSTGGRVTLESNNNKRLVDVNWLTGQVEILEE